LKKRIILQKQKLVLNKSLITTVSNNQLFNIWFKLTQST